MTHAMMPLDACQAGPACATRGPVRGGTVSIPVTGLRRPRVPAVLQRVLAVRQVVERLEHALARQPRRRALRAIAESVIGEDVLSRATPALHMSSTLD